MDLVMLALVALLSVNAIVSTSLLVMILTRPTGGHTTHWVSGSAHAVTAPNTGTANHSYVPLEDKISESPSIAMAQEFSRDSILDYASKNRLAVFDINDDGTVFDLDTGESYADKESYAAEVAGRISKSGVKIK